MRRLELTVFITPGRSSPVRDPSDGTPPRVEVVRTTTPGASASYSGSSAGQVISALTAAGVTARDAIINDVDALESLLNRRPDLVWNGFAGNPIVPSFTGYLERRRQAFVGSGRDAMRLSHHKELGKRTVATAALPTARWFMAQPGQFSCESELPIELPLFVKPSNGGAGAGIDARSVVRTWREFIRQVEAVCAGGGAAALVESYLPGREFTVSILPSDDPGELDVVPVELIAEADVGGRRILGASAKRADNEVVVPIPDRETERQVSRLGLSCFRALGACDYGRIDVRMDREGHLNFLEANLMPEPTWNSYFARACRLVRGLTYDEVISRIARAAWQRTSTSRRRRP